MRTVVVSEFVSVDGVMEAPGGEPGFAHTNWVGDRFSPELGAVKEAEQLAARTLLLGRVTFESFRGAWPHQRGAMADMINTMDKVVVSRTLGDPGWAGTTVVRDLDAVRELRSGDGGPILVAGSRTLVHGLMTAGLVDELRVQMFPVLLGSGKRLWPERPDLVDLQLVHSSTLPSGVVLLTWRPTG